MHPTVDIVCLNYHLFKLSNTDSVQARFPNVQAKDIKATMAQKCKYLRLPKKKRSAPSQDVEADEE